MPLLGNVFDMAGNLRGFLLREYQRHGPIFRVRACNTAGLPWWARKRMFSRHGTQHDFRSWEQYHEFSAALEPIVSY